MASDKSLAPSNGDEMLPEYDLDYRKAKPNRFARAIEDGRMIIVLDADIASVFRTPEAVQRALRKLIEAMPAAPRKS